MADRFSPVKEYYDIMTQFDRIAAQLENPYMGERRTNNRTPKLEGEALAEAKGLKQFEFKGGSVYARNEKEAIKRAKKRGLL